MYLIRAIIRTEKVNAVLSELVDAGFPQMTKMGVYGRGKQKGIQVGEVHYDELPKEMLLLVVKEEDKEDVIKIILKNAKTGEGTYGDGKIFVTPVEKAYTVSSGKEEL